MLADRFSQIFRAEHRAVRDSLLELGEAFGARDAARARALLGRIAVLAGPHLRYEEEALYPSLVSVLGPEYIERLFGDHDRAIGAAQRLVEIASSGALTDESAAIAQRLVRGILPHVSDCDGLSIMVERLPEDTIDAILRCRAHSLQAAVDLLEWAASIRGREAVAPA